MQSSPLQCFIFRLIFIVFISATRIVCYVLRIIYENARYKCCDGSYEDQFHVCSSRLSIRAIESTGVCSNGQSAGLSLAIDKPNFGYLEVTALSNLVERSKLHCCEL